MRYGQFGIRVSIRPTYKAATTHLSVGSNNGGKSTQLRLGELDLAHTTITMLSLGRATNRHALSLEQKRKLARASHLRV